MLEREFTILGLLEHSVRAVAEICEMGRNQIIPQIVLVFRGGPFSSVMVNASGTQCCVYSPLSSFCFIFDLPTLLPTTSSIAAKVVRSSPSIDLVKWHPSHADLLAVLDSQNSRLSIFDVSESTTTPITTFDSNAVDFEFIQTGSTNKRISILSLARNGEVCIATSHITGRLGDLQRRGREL